MDIFDIVAAKREYFQRGGQYYNMFMENFDSETSTSSHFQCDMMPGKTFFYNKQEDEFFLCYGLFVCFLLIYFTQARFACLRCAAYGHYVSAESPCGSRKLLNLTYFGNLFSFL